MLSVADAIHEVLQQSMPLAIEIVPTASLIIGQVLGEDIVSDIDSPPYDKSMMDGFAIRISDLQTLPATLSILEEVTAGHLPTKPIASQECTRIMTGAPIPSGADTVIPIEHIELLDENRIRISNPGLQKGENILPQGREMRMGQVVLAKGSILTPQDFGILASVGKTSLSIYPLPRISVLVTGDELVEPTTTPGPGKIRNTNGPMIVAQSIRAGANPRYLGIARDEEPHLRSLIQEGLRSSDVLILSGGVSAGRLDLVPKVLQDLGVVSRFHKVSMKPGKPIFFGTKENTLVFGLPGNPVSSFACFELFIRSAIRKLRGESDGTPKQSSIPLAEAFQTINDRATYFPAKVDLSELGWSVRALKWFGSADLCGMSEANALLVVPPGEQRYRIGESIPTIFLDR